MAERRRGTQGRPMIYGKSPESRRYWNIAPEDTGTTEENQTQTGKKGNGNRPETDREGDSKSTENGKSAAGRLHLHRKSNTADKKKTAAGLTETQRPKAKAEKPVSGEHRRKRARSYGEQTKLRALWTAFGILCVLLVMAIIYEIVLGNGTKLPGSERITQPTRQEQNKVTTGITLQKNQTEAVQTENAVQAETAAQTEMAVQTGEMQTEAASQTGEAQTEAAAQNGETQTETDSTPTGADSDVG